MPSQDADITKLADVRGLPGLLSERVYLSLRTAILSLDLLPGTVLRKAAICERFGVSRQPVSDAFQKLATDGLVEVFPQSATQVAKLSMAEIRQDTFLREALEMAAAEHAASHASSALISRLDRNLALQEMQLADRDYEEFHRSDQEFHRLILASCSVTRLHRVVQSVSLQIDRARLLILPVSGSRNATLAEHKAIAAAISTKDPGRARGAMRAHLRQLFIRLEPLEAQRPDLFRP